MKTPDVDLNDRLDQLEESLPQPLDATLRLQRTIVGRAADATRSGTKAVAGSAKVIADAQLTAAKTVVGTARHAASVASDAGRTVVGQTRAQLRSVADAAGSEGSDLAANAKNAANSARSRAGDVLEAVEVAVDDDVALTNETYADLTKEELYRRAKSLDISGRSSMSKPELIAAIDAL